MSDTYPMPANGWVCFHCGELCPSPGAARIHFGETPDSTPACRLLTEHWTLLVDVRRLERAQKALLQQMSRVLERSLSPRGE